MKNLLTVALFFASVVSGYSQNKTLLWRVEGKGLKEASYLYGTYHLKMARAQEFGDSVLPAFNRCSTLLVENVDVDSMDKSEIFQSILLKDKSVKDFVSKDDYEFLKVKVPEVVGKAGIMFNAIKPIYTMMMADLQTTNNETEFGVDGYFKNEGHEEGKPTLGIETMKEVQKSLDEIPLDQQCKMLVDFFRNYDTKKADKDTMLNMYQHQDLDAIYNYYQSQKESYAAFNKSLVVARNKKFVNKFISLTKTQSVFCAVGALHLPGETGLINQLQKKGYKVTPVYSKYTPHQLVLDDARDWGYYEETDMLFAMRLPIDPNFEIDTADTQTNTYYEDDTLFDMSYVLVGAQISDSASLVNDEKVYEDAMGSFNKNEKWSLVATRNVTYKNIPCKEVEYNISKGYNARYLMCKRNSYFYCFAVSGSKQKIYSDRADYFFDNIDFIQPKVIIAITVTDEATKKPLKEFSVRVASTNLDTAFAQDTVGFSELSMPTGAEGTYTITVNAKNYVGKKIEINTTNAINSGKSELYIEGDASLLKTKPGVDYSVFNAPVAKAAMINDNTFGWDTTYIQNQKTIIEKKFKPTKPTK